MKVKLENWKTGFLVMDYLIIKSKLRSYMHLKNIIINDYNKFSLKYIE